jgi:hypothetical protein
MSPEIERVFSGVKLNLPASHNQLRPDILKAQECVHRGDSEVYSEVHNEIS